MNCLVVGEFLSTGAVVAGRGTFEPAGGWGGDHHDGAPIWVISRDPAPEFLIPVLLGEGRPLFEHLGADQRELSLMRVRAGDGGVVHLRYKFSHHNGSDRIPKEMPIRPVRFGAPGGI